MTPSEGSRPDYPLMLDLAGRPVLVVGGGPVAAKRARGAARSGAVVTVIAPYVCEDLIELVGEGEATLVLREFEPTDVQGSWLVHTATGERSVDAAVAAAAHAERVWCVRAGDAGGSSAWTPAVARVDDVTVAVTAGADPKRAMSLRTAIQLGLETGELPLRRHRRASVGSVVLVGAGPGDPGLITTRGRRAMAEADVVVVDRLAPRALLAELDDDVEVIDAGKAPHAHTLSQTEINALLVDRARTGQRVVRLKGGDPYVLGRGGEEVRACRAAGVSVEVIPGVSSAIAGPAAAGIPVTHRGVAKAFAVVSGHDGPLDWANLATFDGTLVLLMGVSRLAEISAALARHGLAGTTPVALVEWATTAEERTTIATLDTVTDVAERAGVRAPAVIVVGDVVSLSHVLPFVATQ